jgi:hypothetical protein
LVKLVALVSLTRVIQIDIVLGLRVAGENDTGVGRHDEVVVGRVNYQIISILLYTSTEVT